MQATYTLWQMVGYIFKLGATGFGGPVALVGYMRRDLVEERHWISDEDFQVGLALAQLAPGPLAAQLAIYLGYVHYKILGATLVGVAFVLPSFAMVVALGWLYVLYGGLTWMQSVFYGVGAAVIGIITQSAYQLTTKTLGRDGWLWAIYLVAAAVTLISQSEEVLLFLGAGVLYWLIKAPPTGKKLAGVFPIPLLAVADPTTIFLFFAKAGAFVFGSGLAIVPFLYGGVVKEYQWLTPQQFVDAVAVAMITPGPVVITTGFIGYIVAGFPGALLAAFGTFLPCYLLTIIPAPYFKKYGQQPGVNLFVTGVTAAATGAIAGSVVVLGQRSLTDLPTLALALMTLGLLWKFGKKVQEPILVLGAAVVGLIIYPLTH